ncbi:hypothetical protein BJ742DRAFT_152656 [Cladochytrium replicatum]|nr:hypothetical protein BJ742DRAFT_152656 [Cladochytrium replicatum]
MHRAHRSQNERTRNHVLLLAAFLFSVCTELPSETRTALAVVSLAVVMMSSKTCGNISPFSPPRPPKPLACFASSSSSSSDQLLVSGAFSFPLRRCVPPTAAENGF